MPTLPHNPDAEAAVLGALLIDPDGLAVVAPHLHADDFYSAAYRAVYVAMLDLQHRRQPVDFVTVAETLRQRGALDYAGGYAALSHLIATTPTSHPAHLRAYARLVVGLSLLRRLVALGGELARLGQQGDPADLAPVSSQAVRLVGALAGETADRYAALERPKTPA